MNHFRISTTFEHKAQESRHFFFPEITPPPQLHHFVPVCFHATSYLCANWAYSDSSRHEIHIKIVSFTFKEPESELWPTYLICCHHHFVVNSSRLHPRLCHLQEETRVRVRFGKKASFNVFFHITSLDRIVKTSFKKVLFFTLSVYSWYISSFLHWPFSY